MTIAAIVGIGLLLFGATVLVVLPRRPGAKIAWHGFEISSTGAGLPLIFLGLIAVLSTTTTVPVAIQLPGGAVPLQIGGGSAEGKARPLTACFAQALDAIPGDRVRQLEVGGRDAEVVGPQQSKQESFALQLADGGRPVGLVVFRFFSANELFKVEHVIDQECRPASHQNASRGGDPDALENWDSLRIELAGHVYELRPGFSDGRIEASFSRIAL